jgi:hypothetical protein
MIRRLLKIVELTVPEQRVVVFAVTALLTFVALKTYFSGKHANTSPPVAAEVDQPSPSPGIRP